MNTSRLNSYLFGLLAALTLVSCKSTEAYRSAHTSFSQGAELEMRERFKEAGQTLPGRFIYLNSLYEQDANTADTMQTASHYYEQALKYASKALRGKGQLKKYNALDNTYAIQALALWKQKQYELADTTAKTAIPLLEADTGEKNDQRDIAMMYALPALINIEQAYSALITSEQLSGSLDIDNMPKEQQQAIYDKIKNLYLSFATNEDDGASSISRAIAIIDSVNEKVEGEPDISLYLLNAQLAGVDTWGDLQFHVFKTGRRISVSNTELFWISTERGQYESLVSNLLEKLAAALPDGKENKLYSYWKSVL